MTTARKPRVSKSSAGMKKEIEKLEAELIRLQMANADEPQPTPENASPVPAFVDSDGDGRPDGTGSWLTRWSGYIGWVVVIAMVVWVMYDKNHHKNDGEPTPVDPSMPRLYVEIAPLFPAGTDTTAVDYATFYAAVAEKAAVDKAPLKKSTRDALLSTITPRVIGIAPIIERELGDLNTMPADQEWPADKLSRYIGTFREVSAACLSASSD